MADIELPARNRIGEGGGRRPARLPGAGDVPGVAMPRDPGVAVPNFGASTGYVLEAVGRGVQNVSVGLDQLEAQRVKAEAVAFADRQGVDLQAAALDDYLTSAERAPEGAEGFAASLVQRHQSRLTEALSTAPSEHARKRLQEIGNNIEKSTFGKARIFEHNARAVKVVTDTEKTLETLGLSAFRSPDDIHTWLTLGRDVIANAEANAGLTAAKANALRDKFAKDITAAQVRGLIERDPADALERLKSKEFDGDLGDPDLARRLESEATVRARAADAETAREVGRRVRDAVAVLDAGKVPPDLAEVQALAAGSEYEGALKEANEDRAAVAAFVKLPGREQVAQLRGLAQAETADRRTIDRTRRLERAHGNIVRAIRGDQGLALAADLGVIRPLQGVMLDNPASLRARVAQAEVASAHFGVPISPLTKDETEAFAANLAQQPSEEAVQTLATLRAGFGESGALAVAGSLATKRPGMAMAAAIVGDRPELAREILAGDRLLASNKEAKPSKENMLPAIRDVIGNAFELTGGEAMAPIVDAATAIYAARRVPGGDLSFDADTFEKAMKDAMGGPVTLNGRIVMPPRPGMDASDIRDRLVKMTPDDLAKYGNGKPVFGGGAAFTADRFDWRLVGPSAQLVTVGFGRYLVNFKGLGFVQTPDGEPYELDFGAYLKEKR